MISSLRHHSVLAASALLGNRFEASLAVIGMMVGVGALVTSIALGRGAMQSIDEQLRAAGVNLIVVTAGNYQIKREQEGRTTSRYQPPAQHMERPAWRAASSHADASVDGFAARPALWRGATADSPVGSGRFRWMQTHFEDDPFAKHDHPTAKERLGDTLAGLGAAATLTLADAQAIRREIPGVQLAVSGVHENARLYGEGPQAAQWFTRLHGTEASLPAIRTGWTFPHGSFLTSEHVERGENVVVLGCVVSDRLFGAGTDPVGRDIRLWNQPFRVIGVVGSRSWAAAPNAGDDQFDAAYVPVTTVHRLLNLSKLNTITVAAASLGETTRVASDVVQLLRRRHHIEEAMADDFAVSTRAQQVLGRGLPPQLGRLVAGNMSSVDQLTVEQLSSSMRRANRTMLALLAGVASVSLVVGGVGVTNILLLSITQRTREVGVRLALGARRRDVALQFILEAVMLSVAGGLLGIVGGVLASSALERFFHWSTAISGVSAALALFVSVLLGVAAGFYPARRAAQLDPIEALRHE